jgi:pimeloyl-ACP methyl ester carboxylesterase
MDQRFANLSTGNVQKDTGWKTYYDDQIALLDHLNIKRCHIVGSCIGPSYAFQLMKYSPERFDKCVMLQPIGLTRHTTEPGETWEGYNSDASWRWVGDWANEMYETKKCTNFDLLKGLHHSMFGPDRDFVFSITRQDAAKIRHPLLIFMGKDIFHPSEISREIARITPNSELVEVWRDAGQEKLYDAAEKIERFLLSD